MRNRMIPLVVIAAAVLPSCTSRTVLSGGGVDSVPKVRIWFVRSDGKELSLVPVLRTSSQKDRLEEAVSELLRGPTAEESRSGVASEIPKGTILLGVRPSGSDVELDLSRRFASGGGASSLETRLEQLSRTVADAAGDRKVYLSVEGERLSTAAGEGLEIKQPLN